MTTTSALGGLHKRFATDGTFLGVYDQNGTLAFPAAALTAAQAAAVVASKTPTVISRPGLMVVGNSIAGQSSRAGVSYTSAITAAEVRAGNNSITLATGGVAALGLAQNDYITVGLCSQAPWPVQVTAIAGEVLTLAKRLPRLLRASAGVSKVTSPTFWGGTPRQQIGMVTAANQMAGSPFELLPGYGHGGATAIEIIAALPGLLAHYSPALVVLHLFENDIATASLANLKLWCDQAAGICLSYGAIPLVVHCLPTTSVGAGQAANFDALRDYVLSIGNRIKGAVGCDPGAIYVDTSSPSTPRQPLSGWTDGVVHPLQPKQYTIGAQILPLIQALSSGYPSWASMLIGANVNLAGSGGTATNLVGGSVVPASTTVSADAGVTLTASKTADDKLRLVGSIAGASTNGTSTGKVIQTYSWPKTWGPRTRVKIVADIEVVSAVNLQTINFDASFGGVVADMRYSPTVSESLDPTMIGRRFAYESNTVPLSDVAASSSTMTLTIRPLTLSSPSGVSYELIVHNLGYVVVGQGEQYDGALADA